MKYKYTRKEIIEMWSLNKSDKEWLIPFIKDLLATKQEDNKDYRYVYCCPVHGEYYKVCPKCNPTPSPLEIEEIEEITGVYRDIGGGVSYTQKNKKVDENLSVLINQLISNQKKLYQFIKEKQK